MNDYSLKINALDTMGAFKIAPREMTKALKAGVSRAGMELAREMRRRAPKAHSGLVAAIHSRLGAPPISAIVTAEKNYARHVEEGTGPGGVPPLQTLIDWIRVKQIEPQIPGMEVRDLAFLIRRSISRKGTPDQPYAKPALESRRSRIHALISQAIDRGLMNAGLA